jgi:nucleotide-binding universal stress UspA family protein
MGPIVCGVEGSERDRELLRLGADLAGRLGANLVAVHAFDTRPIYAVHPVPISVPELSEAAESLLERVLADAGVSAASTVVPRPAAVALARLAEERRAGLVVVGSHGSGKLGSLLRGSVVTQLRSRITCPMVVLPRNVEIAPGSGHYELTASAA